MILYGLRLLVALLTFAVGVAAAWLFNFEPSKDSQRESVVVRSYDVTTVTSINDAPQTRSCSLERYKAVVQGGTLDFKAVSKPPAVYPPAAKALGITDTIVVRVMVDEDGKVLTAEATGGHALLREAAEDAARVARFKPTLLSGQPVRVSGDITYNFRLR